MLIGANSTINAPSTLCDGSVILSGSTITKDVEENMIASSRNKQQNKEI